MSPNEPNVQHQPDSKYLASRELDVSLGCRSLSPEQKMRMEWTCPYRISGRKYPLHSPSRYLRQSNPPPRISDAGDSARCLLAGVILDVLALARIRNPKN